MSERVRKRQGVSQHTPLRLAFCVLAVTLLGLPTSSAGAESELVRITGRCVGATEADNNALAMTQLSGYGIDAQVSMPTEVPLGGSATVSVALSYQLSEVLVEGAEALGIESANFEGTEFPVTLLTPSGEQRAVIVPPNPKLDLSAPTRVQLGAAAFDLPTDAPGVFQVRIDSSTLAVRVSPGDLSANATCTDGGFSDLPVGVIVDPQAPTIAPPFESIDVDPDNRRGTVDLTNRVTPGPGPLLPDSLRIVSQRSSGESAADIEDGLLTYDLDDAPLEVIWEICGLSGESSETTTTSTATTSTTTTGANTTSETDTSETDTSETDTSEVTAEDEPEQDVDAQEPAPSTHCAQAMLRLRSTASVVLSDSVQATGTNTGGSGETDPTPPSSGAPVSVTG